MNGKLITVFAIPPPFLFLCNFGGSQKLTSDIPLSRTVTNVKFSTFTLPEKNERLSEASAVMALCCYNGVLP